MKKLMIAASAALCATVGFGEIASANVVGYYDKDLVSGSQGVGVSFMPMSSTGTMADLKVTGYSATDGYADNGITAVKLNTYGQNDGSLMCWVDYEEDGEKWYGWYNGDWDVCFNDVELLPGEGVWFKSPNANFKVQSAGSVLNEALPVPLVAGSQLCPNPTPVVVTMADVAIQGYSDIEGYADNGITAVKLNTYGQNDGSLMCWVDYEEDGEVWYGWYNGDWDVDFSDVELAPGESVWLKSPSATLNVVWPKAL